MSRNPAPAGPWEAFLGIALFIALAVVLTLGAVLFASLSGLARLLRLAGLI